MKFPVKSNGWWIVLFVLALGRPAAEAFPPEPDGIIYGLVKDQFGTPLTSTADEVILQTGSGVQCVGAIQPGLAIGVNYAVHVPMDAAVTTVPYVANALVAATSYQLLVAAGAVTNLPIEMHGVTLSLAKPAVLTRQNLTLGADANGDGIPDAWETVFINQMGLTNVTLANINASTDYLHNGRTLLQEYLLGDIPYNPSDNFSVSIVRQSRGAATLAFSTMTGRSYAAYGSPDLQNWTPLTFRVPAGGSAVMSSYYASSIQPLQIQTVPRTNGPAMQFFRLQLQ